MAKKTAPAKGSAKKEMPAKAKAKPASKPIKKAKVVSAAPKAAKEAPKKTLPKVKAAPEAKAKVSESVKPALMTKKGKNQAERMTAADAKKSVRSVSEKSEDELVVKKQSVVSIIEDVAPAADDSDAKTDKISKVKPVKVDRGNVADEKAKWAELFKKYGKDKAMTYKMTETYPSLIPLQHKVLGWGFVLTNDNDRLEVLFENGIRMLISNYKS